MALHGSCSGFGKKNRCGLCAIGILAMLFSCGDIEAEFEVTYERGKDSAVLWMRSDSISDKIEIKNPPKRAETEFNLLFSNLGLLYLISPHLPERVRLKGFQFSPAFNSLLKQLYSFSNRPPPKISNGKATEPRTLPVKQTLRTSPRKVAVLYSAGKDSIYNMMTNLQERGRENVLGIHFWGLNDAASTDEYRTTVNHAKTFGYPPMVYVRVRKSSRYLNHNDTQGMRNVFAMGVGAIYALEFGAGAIVTQGFSPALASNEFTCSGRECSLIELNHALLKLGFPILGTWEKIEELDALDHLYRRWKEMMPRSTSCFAPPCWRGGRREHWAREAPKLFSVFYENQCGSCIKCKMDLMARLLADPAVQEIVPPYEVAYFIRHTRKWIKKNGEAYPDFLTPTFWTKLGQIQQSCAALLQD